MTNKKRRLGRGLEALLGAYEEEPTDDALLEDATEAEPVEPPRGRPARTGAHLIDLCEIDENPFQPRRDFSEAEIASLAESLREHEMLQPVLVRRAGDRYQLISGERRLRAAKRAGWTQIPAQVREADDRLVAELAIVENLQRKDLNAIEKALSFQRYLQQHRCTQEELANRLKINRTTIANLIRLLELPDQIQADLAAGRISAGHARALLPLGDEQAQLEFAQRIAQEEMSVRDTEREVQEHIRREDGEPAVAFAPGTSENKKKTRSEHIASLEQELKMAVGAKVEIRESGKGRGRIVLHFKSHDDFERIFDYLAGDTAPRRQAG